MALQMVAISDSEPFPEPKDCGSIDATDCVVVLNADHALCPVAVRPKMAAGTMYCWALDMGTRAAATEVAVDGRGVRRDLGANRICARVHQKCPARVRRCNAATALCRTERPAAEADRWRAPVGAQPPWHIARNASHRILIRGCFQLPAQESGSCDRCFRKLHFRLMTASAVLILRCHDLEYFPAQRASLLARIGASPRIRLFAHEQSTAYQ